MPKQGVQLANDRFIAGKVKKQFVDLERQISKRQITNYQSNPIQAHQKVQGNIGG